MLEQRIETNKRVRRSNVSNVRPINYDSWDALKEKPVGMMASFDMRLVEYERARLAKRRSEWTGLGNGQPYANAGGWVSVAPEACQPPRPRVDLIQLDSHPGRRSCDRLK